jgi:IS5 family transposase
VPDGERVRERKHERELRVSGGVVLRPCRREDLRLLEWSAELQAHRRFVAEQFERAERGENAMILAEIQGEVVGQVWVDFEARDVGAGPLRAPRLRHRA